MTGWPGGIERGHIDPSIFCQRLVELRDLVTLRQVGIEVILARKHGVLAHLAVDRCGGKYGKLHRTLVQHRQGPRQTKADGADMGVGLTAELVGAATEALVFVSSCTWTSSPMTGSYRANTSGETFIAETVITLHSSNDGRRHAADRFLG